MRRVGYHLGQSFVRPAITVIEHHREDDGDGKTRKKPVDIDGKGIPDNVPTPVIVKEFFKIIQTNPRASEDAPGNHKTPKGYLRPVHREVAKHENEDKGNKDKKVQFPVSLKFLFPALFFHV
jgi:hypothetical protein